MMNLKHFLTGAEFTRPQIEDLLLLAQTLKNERDQNIFRKDLVGKHLALVFEKPSLRTRVSFTVAMQELGGQVVELNSLGRKKEEPEDTIRVLQGYVHGCMIRTHEHSIVEKMVAHAKIPVINGLSDSHHPCQGLADLLTLKQVYGQLRGLSLCYIGDGNNVLHSLLLLAPVLGVNVNYACPRGYEPNSFIVHQAIVRAQDSRTSIRAFVDPAAACKGTNAVYTDVWTSMGFEQEETDRDKIFAPFQINEELFKYAASDAIIMHCMPMIRGKEITEKMVDHPRAVLFQQSENRLHVQKALLVNTL